MGGVVARDPNGNKLAEQDYIEGGFEPTMLALKAKLDEANGCDNRLVQGDGHGGPILTGVAEVVGRWAFQ